MVYHSFEDLDVWKRAIDLSINIYRLLHECRDYGFKDQICRASVSVPSNIAEGMERHSAKETVHFLHIAKGFCVEVRTQLIIAARIKYISEEQLKELSTEAVSISRMLHSLAVSLKPKS